MFHQANKDPMAGSGFVSGNESELWTPTTTALVDSSLTFGDETVGKTVGGTLRLTNTGEEPLFVGRPALGGVHPGDFALGAQRCGAAIAPGATCRLELRFTPGVQAYAFTFG